MAYFKVLPRHSPGWTEDNHVNLRIAGSLAEIRTSYLPITSYCCNRPGSVSAHLCSQRTGSGLGPS
jgi:hypothetical protein